MTSNPQSFLFLWWYNFANRGLAAAVKWRGRGGHSGSCRLGWQQRWTCRQPATGLDHFLDCSDRGKNKLLMCLSWLPSIVQMRCCPVQLNAVYKYSNSTERQWHKLKHRQREGKRKTEREAVYTACPHFYQAVSGVHRGLLCRLGNSWWEKGGRSGHLSINSFRSDAELWCEHFIFVFAWELFGEGCVGTVNHVCQIASFTCRRKAGPVSF